MAFLNFVYIYILRLNVNIAIVAMVNYTAIPHVDAAVVSQECQLEGSGNQTDETDEYIRLHSSPVIGIRFQNERVDYYSFSSIACHFLNLRMANSSGTSIFKHSLPARCTGAIQ